MNPISNKLSWKYQKNKHLVEALVLRNAPEFIYKVNPPEIDGEIPVFTFHVTTPEWFEEQCLYLAGNGYKTLSAEEFHHALSSTGRKIKNAILLTFDDGLKHVWTIAYPLLKKYNLKATCFLIPGCIPDNYWRVRPTLEEYWKGQASLGEIVSLGGEDPKLSTWEEIKIMHESGVIDFQSHTMYHSLVFTSNKIFDFIHPDYKRHFYGNIHVPLYRSNGKDIVSREPFFGMPIYFSKPRMSAERRYFDDQQIRNLCIERVDKEGGNEFFSRKNWRRVLDKIVSDYRKTSIVKERYETLEERDKTIFDELLKSKEAIEEKLQGKAVTHLCYPWYEAEDFAVRASVKAGFRVNYFGQIKGRPSNRIGADLLKVVRQEEIFLLRLPGAGRKRIIDIFKQLYDLKRLPSVLFGS
jgi:hypothetical protein